jgi:N-acetyl-gamma-glutamyl-phosphate reductase
MTYRAAVVGASGYTGAELLRLLAGHPEIDVAHVTAESNAGAAVTDLFPALTPAYGGVRFAPLSADDLRGHDLAFVALPHGASQDLLPGLLDDVAHVVDLGADFRLPADVYEQWYGEAHRAPAVLDRFASGPVEISRDELARHDHVAAPGCYPTAVSLACAPLFASGVVEPHVVADAVSGVSGAGRAPKVTSLFSEANENVNAYGLLTHRHTAEMELFLGRVAGGPVSVLFTPHLVPITRGIHATCHLRPAVGGLTTESLLATYRDFYADDPCVVVSDQPPATRATYGANVAHVTVRADARTGSILALGAIDNLVKGASGQMIQAANILLGLPETTGLPLLGVQP